MNKIQERIKSYKTFVNRKKNTRHIESIKPKEDVILGKKYPGFKAQVEYKDGSVNFQNFLYGKGYIKKWKD